ncbi:hypothetical protein [Psychromonas sp. Urea-02u-13]|uniref:hypothetical protein n=1 Tax=Psychromonas sp. Urea-02u-13 TaxID=2058326 RepID=UPI000C3498FD|nr:hypothetical protein [Psychromonas sp. Urea-02u-13]PKG37132.1 hypothetical protein CXF74_20480 [Psychromonas sp. Urea-02u-13]
MRLESNLALIEYINKFKTSLIESDNVLLSREVDKGLSSLNGFTDGWAMLLESVVLVKRKFQSELNNAQLNELDNIIKSVRNLLYPS